MYHEANFFEINNCLERCNFIQSSVTLYRVALRHVVSWRHGSWSRQQNVAVLATITCHKSLKLEKIRPEFLFIDKDCNACCGVP